MSSSAIQNIVDKLRCQYLRKSTHANYYNVWKTFNTFNLHLDKMPRSWEDRLTLFIGYLVSQNRKSSTIKSYISAIKAVLKYEKIILNEDKVMLAVLVKACKLQNDYLRPHLPVRKGLLYLMISSIGKFYGNNSQPYLETMYKAIFSTLYFVMFRIGELTQSQHIVKAKDVHI